MPPAAGRSVAKLSFALVFPDRSGRMISRGIGAVHGRGAPPGRSEEGKTLHAARFVTGDYLDVAIFM